jgi:hypothetical protein
MDVSILGIKAGYIYDIQTVPLSEVEDKRYIDPKSLSAIKITIAISKPVTLWNNYKVRFVTKTLFSGRYLEIDPGGFDDKNKIDFPEAYFSSEEPEYDSPFLKGNPSARYYDDLFYAGTTVLRENQKDIQSITKSLADITGKLNKGPGTIPKLIHSDEMYLEIQELTKDGKTTAKGARHYQEAFRNMESSMPVPFTIRASFYGRTTVGGFRVGPKSE